MDEEKAEILAVLSIIIVVIIVVISIVSLYFLAMTHSGFTFWNALAILLLIWIIKG